MATLLTLKSVHDKRGMLTVLDNIDESLPFPIKRIFYIQEATDSRGGHRHYYTQHAVICIVGSCKVTVNDGISESTYLLNSPSQCLIMETSDWHTMHSFSKDAILLALASTVYDPTDYIYSPYEKNVMADDTV